MRLLPASTPTVATPRVLALTTGLLYVVGGCAVALIGAGLGQRQTVRALVVAVAAVAIVIGLALLGWGESLPRWCFHTLVATGTVLITVMVATAPTAQAEVAFAAIYVFIAVDAFFFFAWPQAVLQLGLMLIAQTVVVSVHGRGGPGVALALALLWTSVGGVVGAIVRVASSARVDSLTGLANRRGWDDELRSALDLAHRRQVPLSVALIDVDHFKRVNDQLGHAAGDDLLRGLAEDWSAALPSDSRLARRGGDEFALLLPGRNGPQALVVVERMRAAGRTQAVSCGVAEHQRTETGGDLLRRTDAALYTAKAAGRGRTVLSGQEHDSLVRDLAVALERQEIEVVFQPILALGGTEAVGVEALARWERPQHGLVSPAEFIPAAESAGLIGALGASVLRKACAGALLLQRSWGQDLLLTVNASGRELTEPGYGQGVLDTLRQTGWPAHRLVVEVTESLVDGSTERALETLAQLREHQIAVAIDDFGMGYSAFSRLDTLPADYLKLDRSFIAPITTSRRRLAMLRALLELSHNLGLMVIAEGVETPEQAQLLADLGCPLVQGYLYGRPLPPALCALPSPRRAADTGAGNPPPGQGRSRTPPADRLSAVSEA
ncbi:MAG TPA: bifunctional diguanylate cyclase/phosphodiesterase [Kineosporiaceae bacterium]|nr:bifunctional diguanylate cyclase/phosphodiesterase [Kineosporiaceae bacterium]